MAKMDNHVRAGIVYAPSLPSLDKPPSNTINLVSVLGVLMTSGMGPFVTLMEAYYDYSPRTDDLMTYPTLFMGIGNIIAMPLAMAIGRRPVFLGSALILTVGSIWCAASTSLSSHIAGRDVLSLAAGQSEALCPLIIQVHPHPHPISYAS